MGLLVVVAWYLLIIASSWVGFHIGQVWASRAHRGMDARDHLSRPGPYLFLTLVGAASFLYLFVYLVRHLGLSQLAWTIASGQANVLHQALYDQYSIGLFSLRYVLILSGGLAIFRILSKRSCSVIDFLNITMLLLVALVASRLSIIFALTIGCGLWVFNGANPRLSLRKYGIVAAGFFLLLSAYNYTRNALYYARVEDQGFLTAGASEMMAYLGAPFQGSLAAGQYLAEFSAPVNDWTVYTHIEAALTTNSALLELARRTGLWSLAWMALMALGSSAVMGLISKRIDGYLGLIYLVLLYCYAELWRVLMFDKGIIMTLLVFSALCVPVAWLTHAGTRFGDTSRQRTAVRTD